MKELPEQYDACNGQQGDEQPGESATGKGSPWPDDWQHIEVPVEQLLRTLEDELIPRLLIALPRRDADEAPATVPDSELPTGPWASGGNIRRLADRCIDQDIEAVNSEVVDLLGRGVSLESIYLHLVAPAARELGERWNTDEASFAEVSLGLCCLHRLLCDCESVGFRCAATPDSHSILLTSTPGDQHTFGIAMAADFFRRYGWQVSNLSGLDAGFIVERLRGTYYSALGLSLHSDQNLESLDRLIGQARRISCNQNLLVVVGGDFFLRHPRMVKHVGADLLAVDGHKAILDTRAAMRLRTAIA